MSDLPLISILINNYNYAPFLREAIDSALAQTYPNKEVVVVDDGSTDDSRKILESYGDRIVSVLKQNGGQASAFNAGFAASTGSLICFLDADDYFAADKLAHIFQCWQRYSAAGWMFHALEDVDAAGETIRARSLLEDGEVDYRAAMRNGGDLPSFPATTGLCFRRDVLEQVLPMPESIRISADQFLRWAATFVSPGILNPELLAVHRIHGDNRFEARKDTAAIRAEVNIRTVYHLRERFPQMQPFTNQIFAHALGQLLGRRGIRTGLALPETQQYLRKFWSLDMWISGIARTLYNYLKAIRQPPLTHSPTQSPT